MKIINFCIKWKFDERKKMAMVGTQIALKDSNQNENKLKYWLSRSPQERLQAVTTLVR